MPGYKLIVKNAKVILKTVTNAVLNITGIKDLLTGSGSVDSNNKIDWTLQEYTNTAANFTSNNPILLLGQKGIETDDLLTAPKFKIGNGVTAWNSLPYANSGGGGGGSYVPYTGATSDVNLGEFELKAGQVEFDQTPTGTSGVAVMRWNDTDGTLDLGLKGGNVTLQVGQEQVLRVVNKTATNVNLLEANYQAVRVTGAQGQRLKVDLALATNDLLSAETIGLVTETIANNQEGFITTSGLVRGINTTGSLQSETWADGDVLYLSPTTAGNITNIKPIAPNHMVIIGYVVYAHITQGTIFVKVDNGLELDELHNVLINSVANNDVLTYDSATSLWKNKQSSLEIMHLDTIDSATLTGTTAQTLISTYQFNANNYLVGDVIRFYLRGRKIGTNSSITLRIYYNTINSLSGATALHSLSISNTQLSFSSNKNGVIKSASATEFYPSGIANDESSNATTASSNVNIDYTAIGYFIIALINSSAADSTTISLFEVQRKR